MILVVKSFELFGVLIIPAILGYVIVYLIMEKFNKRRKDEK